MQPTTQSLPWKRPVCQHSRKLRMRLSRWLQTRHHRPRLRWYLKKKEIQHNLVLVFKIKFWFAADIDECRDRPGICNNGECNNFQGSFQCVCRSGYTLTPGRDSCVDIDECQRNPNICNNGTCLNTLGSYKCHCYSGFKLSPNNDCAG